MIKREYGKVTAKNGEIYIGQWKDDLPNGKGTIYYKDKDGKKNGLDIDENSLMVNMKGKVYYMIMKEFIIKVVLLMV